MRHTLLLEQVRIVRFCLITRGLFSAGLHWSGVPRQLEEWRLEAFDGGAGSDESSKFETRVDLQT